jgi:glycolate oxidase FAD binding subunit
MEALLEQWCERVRGAAADGNPLRLRGGGSKDFYGQRPVGEPVDTRGYRGIVSYEPTELVVTARCGTPLAELEAELARRRQMLAFEPPRFGAATLGGCIAAGLSGPRRRQVGAARDFVLGARLLDGRGRLLDFGGQVMKNVAGYDVSRLLCGSLGTLGLIAEVSLKVLPLPAAECTLALELDEAEALARMREWGRLPLPVSATAWCGGLLRVRLSGARAAVDAARQRLGGTPEETGDFWSRLREQAHDFFAGDERPLWRIALPVTAPPLALGDTLIERSGGQRWLRGELPAPQLRARVQALGGSATLFRGGDKGDGAFTPPSPALLRLHRNLKREFDPAGIFNPGRLYADL